MKQCHKCLTVWGSEQTECPICLTELQANEYSSEDADDGVFTDPYTDADIIDDLAYECYTLRQDNINLIEQINGRTQ